MITDAEMYAEVFDLLKYMNKQTVMKIPVEYLEYIKKEKSDTYVTRVNKNDIDNPNNIDQRTINLFTWLTVNYFSTDAERKEILRVATENEYKNKFNEDAYNKIFGKTQKNETIKAEEFEKPAVIKKSVFSKIEKIINFIRSIFN